MIIKQLLLNAIKDRWTSLIENPTGFPHTPPEDTCWTWIGSSRTPGATKGNPQPNATFLGQKVNPRNLLYAIHRDIFSEHHPLLKPQCRNPLCINPTHQREAGTLYPHHSFDENQLDWASLFEALSIPRDLPPEEIANQTGAPIDAAKAWSTSK